MEQAQRASAISVVNVLVNVKISMHKKGENLQLTQEKYMELHLGLGTTLGPSGHPPPTEPARGPW